MAPSAAAGNYDYVIVGGGTAGCGLANRLTAGGRHSVLLVEGGPEDRYPWIHIPLGYGKTMFHPVYNWGFHTDPDPGMDGRRIYWPRGRCLGGSSSINGLIYVRGQPEDYDRWAAEGNRGWGWRDVLPYFVRSEGNQRGASAAHGADGPLKCSDIGEKYELMEAIIAGAGELGVPRTDDFNGGVQEGVGYYQLFTHNGWRCSTAVAYLKPARGRAGLAVETNAQATRVLIEHGRASGVEYRRGGETRTARARREVILAAGALLLLAVEVVGARHARLLGSVDERVDYLHAHCGIADHERAVRTAFKILFSTSFCFSLGRSGHFLFNEIKKSRPPF